MSSGYEILEHTADIGIRAWGGSLAECFGEAAWGLAEILGARHPEAPIEDVWSVEASATDREALLVAFLNELIALHETNEVGFKDIGFSRFSDTSLTAEVCCARLKGETETTGVKAATYHQLEIRDTPDGAEARVYLDV